MAWKYIRASMSLCSFVPPVCDVTKDGLHYLVDGGYLSTIPSDLMAEQFRPDTIISCEVGERFSSRSFFYVLLIFFSAPIFVFRFTHYYHLYQKVLLFLGHHNNHSSNGPTPSCMLSCIFLFIPLFRFPRHGSLVVRTLVIHSRARSRISANGCLSSHLPFAPRWACTPTQHASQPLLLYQIVSHLSHLNKRTIFQLPSTPTCSCLLPSPLTLL